jgi:glyoxylase-like metal-dependent hydrolase (beta-lactamase superfamily II)
MFDSMHLAAEDTYLIDSRFLGLEKLAAVYFVDASLPALVETSGALVADQVIDRLRSAGIDDLAYIVVTHIHLDHAGAAGHILEAYPNAKLVVHPLGARHMADPEKLHRSAERVYGQKAMREEWGYLRPVPSSAIIAAEDGQELDLGNRRLRLIHTPGHAKHHMSVWDDDSGMLFVGDSAGVYFSDADYQTPSAPPPDLDPYLACESLKKLQDLSPQVICFTHFGPTREAERLLENAERQYIDWLRVAEESIEKGYDAAATAQRFESELDPRRKALSPEIQKKVDSLVPHIVQAEGYMTYLKRGRSAAT